jgi:hypothetical protein
MCRRTYTLQLGPSARRGDKKREELVKQTEYTFEPIKLRQQDNYINCYGNDESHFCQGEARAKWANKTSTKPFLQAATLCFFIKKFSVSELHAEESLLDWF